MSGHGKRILLIEDENGLVVTLTDRLTIEGYIVLHAHDGAKGEQMAIGGPCDIILLDVMLPKKGGFDVLRDIRKEGVATPVLMLTARGEVGEKVVGLKLGADDYLTKPFEMLELLARIESLLRRPAATSAAFTTSPVYSFGPFTIDFQKMEIAKKGEIIGMSAREFQLLRYFVEHRGSVLSRDAILNDVWGHNAMPTTRTIDTHVTWLRQKLEDNSRLPKYILTVHGFGYKFVG
jgi:two-component system alkaline phosphatase synthesis response regulator PhoP